MFKNIKKVIVMILVLAFVNIGLSRCYGSYILTKKVHRWNGTLGNKWVKSGVNIVLAIFIYGPTLIIDFLLLNTLEFWTGSNPLAMAPGESETQIVEAKGEKIQITATQNRFDIEYLTGEKKGEKVSLVYNTDESAWYMQQQGQKAVKVAYMLPNEPGVMTIKHPDGQAVKVSL